ncbi:MAG: hypothetical protein ACWIPI_06215 [Polaribacter sp.]
MKGFIHGKRIFFNFDRCNERIISKVDLLKPKKKKTIFKQDNQDDAPTNKGILTIDAIVTD